MNVLIAADSFKGSLTSLQVAEYVRRGIMKVYEDAAVQCVPIADGGEGTVEAVVYSVNGSYRQVSVHNPLGERITARYGDIGKATAIIEMAESTGLSLIPEEKRNPLKTTSYGLGEQIRDALDQGFKRIVLGIGGSATNDGGAGMARALGAVFTDEQGNELDGSGGSLGEVAKIDLSHFDSRVYHTEFIVACDVTNPLCGEKGASAVYGPQKGATSVMVNTLDNNLAHFADVIEAQMGVSVRDIPGSGAAGGAGGGLIAFCRARIVKGIEYILDLMDIDSRIREADVVITGEGRMDWQSAFGKVPVGIARRAGKYGKPVFAICGSLGKGAEAVYEHGIAGAFSAIVAPVTLEQAIAESPVRIEEASERLFRTIRAAAAIGKT